MVLLGVGKKILIRVWQNIFIRRIDKADTDEGRINHYNGNMTISVIMVT